MSSAYSVQCVYMSDTNSGAYTLARSSRVQQRGLYTVLTMCMRNDSSNILELDIPSTIGAIIVLSILLFIIECV